MGSTPVSEATARVQALIAEARDPIVRARLLVPRAVLAAASGHFDEARALMAESTAITPPAEAKALRCTCLSYAARIELLAGNVLRAEELARELCDYYWAEGMVAYLSSELMFLVDALIAQGRLDEAAVELGRAGPLAAPDDIDAHFRQARSRARLELARGDLDAAEQSARQAVTRVLEVEAPDEHAETLLVLARVLLAAGNEAEGRAAAEEALEIVVARENLPLGEQARELLTPSKPLQVFPPIVRTEAQA
jgi:tetratricopeptide (TPR) repeat protein